MTQLVLPDHGGVVQGIARVCNGMLGSHRTVPLLSSIPKTIQAS